MTDSAFAPAAADTAAGAKGATANEFSMSGG